MGIRSQGLADWSDYAGRLLGMQKVDSGGGSMAFRMDDWRQRLVVIDEGGDEFAFMGWQVADPSDLDGMAARIEEPVSPSPRRAVHCVTSGSSSA